jgi:hypothetical protein
VLALRHLTVSVYPAGVRIIAEPKDNGQADALIEVVASRPAGI